MPTCVQPSWSINGVFGTTPKVTDPVQGPVLKNCSLIAAFASLAWKGMISVQTVSPYTFKFYRKDVNNNVIGDSQKADGILPADSTGKLMHARSDDPSKYWPALYEKAYYMWLDQVGLNNSSGRPDYCKYVGWQNPVTILFQLTGKTVIQKSCPNADTVFNDIDAFCVSCAKSTTNRSIRNPAVAWTYDPTISNPNNAVYSDTTIAAQHTYSLLGVAKLGTALTQKYIVLRNPYGKSKGDPVMPGYLYTGPALWCNNINLGDNDGIFALRIDQFVKYFAGYAWIV